jgi:hypothetical protein
LGNENGGMWEWKLGNENWGKKIIITIIIIIIIIIINNEYKNGKNKYKYSYCI